MEWLGERARVGSWRGEHQVAHLSPASAAPLSGDFVRHCLDWLAGHGFTSVIGSALPRKDCDGFLDAGFEVREELHLLVHDLEGLPSAPHGLRRAGRRDQAAVLELDAVSFDPFWQLGPDGLDDALRATSHVRFRVTGRRWGRTAGYAITGRSGATGYLQRLAVHPAARGAGLGRALVTDGLWWIRRHGAGQALVNTQRDNDAALALYRSCGFRLQRGELCVLQKGL